MVWTLRLAAQAEQDMTAVLAWTHEHFGGQQARTYAETLSLALTSLMDGPDIIGVTPRDDIVRGIRTLHVARNGRRGRHFIVFRIGGENLIDVLRVLHDSMELPRHVGR